MMPGPEGEALRWCVCTSLDWGLLNREAVVATHHFVRDMNIHVSKLMGRASDLVV